MRDQPNNRPLANFLGGLNLSIDLPWFEIAGRLWRLVRTVLHVFSSEGMYEVLEYESTLELIDKKGSHARVKKRQKVRYLQDNIIAYQDQAWGDGDILLNYRCTPGKAVDFYTPGNKTIILISLQEVKQRGDKDEFHIEWEMKKGFLREKEQWETEVRHRTGMLRPRVVFPVARPPKRFWLTEEIRKRTREPGENTLTRLPDGRWLVSCEIAQPRMNEVYSIRWEW